MAVAPTATISNIAGCFPTIEPIYRNIYVKSNISGEFTIVNHYLVDDLKKINLWNDDMLEKLKYFDGNIEFIQEIPDNLKQKYKGAFEIDPEWLIELTAVKGKWIDQSLSHNVFLKGTSGKKLSDVYIKTWHQGLKTTYYLRSLGASQIEKSTLSAEKFGFTQKREYNLNKQEKNVQVETAVNEIKIIAETAKLVSSVQIQKATNIKMQESINIVQENNELQTKVPATQVNACRIEDPYCEACQ